MTERKATNIVWHAGNVTREDREKINGHKGCTVWFTGLSGSGKSTIAVAVEKALWDRGVRAYILDGDNIRHGLNRNLGFSAADREENIRRIGEVARLFVDAGVMVLCSFISPFRAERRMVRELVEAGEFVEIFVDTPIEECMRRDPKGLYAKARSGAIPNFTGIDSPYEPPEAPEITLRTVGTTPEALAQDLLRQLRERGFQV